MNQELLHPLDRHINRYIFWEVNFVKFMKMNKLKELTQQLILLQKFSIIYLHVFAKVQVQGYSLYHSL